MSLTHKNPQRRKIIHGMARLTARTQRSIDLNMCIFKNIRPVRVISVGVIMGVV